MIEYTTDTAKTYEIVCEGGNEKKAIDALREYLNNLGVSDFKVLSVEKMGSFPISEK